MATCYIKIYYIRTVTEELEKKEIYKRTVDFEWILLANVFG